MNLSRKVLFSLQVAATCSVLAACATAPAKTAYVPVPMAVASTCIPKALSAAPAVEAPKALAEIPDGPTRLLRITAAYLTLYARSLETEPVIAACR